MDSEATPTTHSPRLAWQLIAGGSGPYLFLVHGMLSSHLQWRPNLVALRRQVRPVLFDLWGHGDSPCPLDRAPYEADALVAQLEQTRETLNAERILLCGQSFGAGLTMRYALAHPARVAALIITNSMSALSPPDAFGSIEQRKARAATIEAGGRQAIAQLPFHPRHARRLAPALQQTLIEAADRVDPRAFARLSTISAPQLSMCANLQRIAPPTLLVNGLWEKAFQPLRDLAQRAIPNCQVADIEAGHAVNMENAPAFNAAVEGFIDSVQPQSLQPD